jgi:hypothetical protein
MEAVNVIPVYKDFKEFYVEKVLPYKNANPMQIRLDGKNFGTSKKVAAYFWYADKKWRVESDTYIDRLKLAYENFDKNDEPFLVKHTRDNKGECLVINGQPLRDKKFFVYAV